MLRKIIMFVVMSISLLVIGCATTPSKPLDLLPPEEPTSTCPAVNEELQALIERASLEAATDPFVKELHIVIVSLDCTSQITANVSLKMSIKYIDNELKPGESLTICSSMLIAGTFNANDKGLNVEVQQIISMDICQ